MTKEEEEIIKAYNDGYLVDTRTNNMYLYKGPSNTLQDIFINELESAIGFRLLAWQKYYILEGRKRFRGTTTTEIIKLLLETDEVPMDLRTIESTRKYIQHEASVGKVYAFRKKLIEYKTKLTAAGIPTRKILAKTRVIY